MAEKERKSENAATLGLFGFTGSFTRDLARILRTWKRKRGRPRKPIKEFKPKGLPGRPTVRLFSVAEIEEFKKRHGARTDKEALEKAFKAIAVSRKHGNHRAKSPAIQATIKTFRNKFSLARQAEKNREK